MPPPWHEDPLAQAGRQSSQISFGPLLNVRCGKEGYVPPGGDTTFEKTWLPLCAWGPPAQYGRQTHSRPCSLSQPRLASLRPSHPSSSIRHNASIAFASAVRPRSFISAIYSATFPYSYFAFSIRLISSFPAYPSFSDRRNRIYLTHSHSPFPIPLSNRPLASRRLGYPKTLSQSESNFRTPVLFIITQPDISAIGSLVDTPDYQAAPS